MDDHYKVVLLGDSGVGKTSLVLRFVKNEYKAEVLSTIGAAFFAKTVQTSQGTVKFEIWDTAGQERYRSLTPMYYRDASSIVVAYDITDEHTFRIAQNWVDEVTAMTGDDVVIILVGNKSDCSATDRAIDRSTAESYAAEKSLLFVEASAKTGACVNDIFVSIAEKLVGREGKGSGVDIDSTGGSGGCGC
ncbi:Small GTPase like protein [Aduncisulcus paluster]|uniref:Small GTPase like protein n=1 Tax=Aduncisulcus paluster TaxID=2918883 RepID=A0ABQ5K2J8_9EUKA|nr:Small GTPase like protein [Aduncisulcus paluster]|eukprot:gnl/Carplike_NY0171/1546_a2098_1126.p1 GENE.gnl/Carplike_NY0171/1546_a2098_1126~~gnl/Carplike_NY0171/1546_a2098_1126.p1  ORF type:complete len:190 (+),score=50.11 gnl/Carplike_NY0171/1546_a2098_1126:23-592(+)